MIINSKSALHSANLKIITSDKTKTGINGIKKGMIAREIAIY